MQRKFSDQEQIRRAKLEVLQNENLNPYEVERVKRSMTLTEFKLNYKNVKKHLTTKLTLAGRIVALRQTFGVIKDFLSSIQFYINKKTVNSEVFNYFKKMVDIGDIVEIQGSPFKTQKGELTLDVTSIKIIAKALKPLPEKWHGLQDEELRARHRYVDLIMNQNSVDTFILRSKIIKLIREFMDSQNFLEVETPVLHPVLGGANAKPFITHLNALKRNFYLRIATELPLKKLIVGGFDRIYEIGRIFRNEGMDAMHNPEFTSMEVYAAYWGMEEQMQLTESIFKYLAKKLKISSIETNEGKKINLTKKFERIHMVDLIKKVCNVDFFKVKSDQQAIELANKFNLQLENHQKNKGHIINLFFEEFCEKECIQPVFVWGHPIEVSPLAKKDEKHLGFTKRFELFINTKEYANAFAELNDPIDQLNRFEEQIKEKQLGNEEATEMDMDFIEALEYGLPPTGGMGLGIDRLVMLFANKTTIRDVLLFPHMREKVGN